MKTLLKRVSWAGLLLAALGGRLASAQTLIISDQYNVANSGSGFALGSGVNSGINPPTTRLTGTQAANLRYYQAVGTKAASAHYITNSAKLAIAPVAVASTLSLSTNGTSVFDFGPALNAVSATPALPGVYDVTINIANATLANARCSFAISSAFGQSGAWDFGIQIYHANTGDAAYTLQKRIATTAAGLATAINNVIGTVGTYSNEVAFLIRVTDAGAESGANYHSRVQVSVDGGSTWIYDTVGDVDLPNGWRFPALTRYVFWDIAPNAGVVTYDNFTINWLSGPSPTAPRVWTGGGTSDSNWSTAANWSGVVPNVGDALIFNGLIRQANNNDLSGLGGTSLIFSNGGFNLSGNALVNVGAISNLAGLNIIGLPLAWPSSGAIWNLAPNSEVQLTGANWQENAGNQTFNGGGTLRLKGSFNIGMTNAVTQTTYLNDGQIIVDGGSFTSRGGFRIGEQTLTAASPQLVLTNGAAFTLTIPGSNIRVGGSTNPLVSTLVVDHSTLTLSGGAVAIPNAAGATGVVSQIGGLVTGGRINFSLAGAGMGTYTAANGTLEVLQVLKTTAGGLAQIYFDNAILRTATGATNSPFMNGLDVAQINAGGLTLDTTTTDVSIGQALTGSGGLTKTGSYTATLTGPNTFAGNTAVNQGSLILSSVQTNVAAIQVASGATLGVLYQAPGTTLTAGSLNLAASALTFDFGNNGNSTGSVVKVSSLSASGGPASVTVNVANGPYLQTGQIVLLKYSGAIGGGFAAFTLGSLPSGMTANLVNNTGNSSIDLNITGVPGFLWTGAVSGDWDGSTLNWLNGSGSPATYADGYVTKFLDGAATGTINIPGFPIPSSILVSNSALPYVWSGGGIGNGSQPLLIKKGSGTLTRIDGEADLIPVFELDQGTVVISNTFPATFTTVLTDNGSTQGVLAVQTPYTLTASSANTNYHGAFLLLDGILKPTTALWFGTTNGGTTITNNATLDLNFLSLGDEPVVVSGAGVNGQGAIIDSTTSTTVRAVLKNVTLAGDTVFGAPNGGRWDLRITTGTGDGPGLAGNGHNLTKVGSGMVSIACALATTNASPYWRMNLGNISVNEGTLAFAQAVDLGNPAAGMTVSAGATLQLFNLGLTNPVQKSITMTDAFLNGNGGATGTNVINGSMQLSGVINVSANQATTVVNGPIGGTGSVVLTANSPGALILNGTNTYSSGTIVSNGIIGGTGIMAGNLTMVAGTCAPGYNGVGALTVNGNVTLAGTTLMELDRAQTPNSDRLVVGGSLAFGGSLQVVLGAGAASPQANDTYQLFNKGGSGIFTQITLPDLSALPGGLTWNTNNLLSSGSISVNGTALPPVITAIGMSGTNFTFSGSGGVAGQTYYVVGATNVTTPLPQWVPVATNVYEAGGYFHFTNHITSGPAFFYRVEQP